MNIEHTLFPVANALPPELNGTPVVLFHRPTDRAASTNGASSNGKLSLDSTPDHAARPSLSTSTAAPAMQLAGMTLAELEKLAIIQTLQEFDGNRTKAARSLGVSVRTLQRKLRIWRSANRSQVGDAITEECG